MSSSLFSTYATGENRVTGSILAVLQSLSLARMERLLGALLEQPELQLVRFDNQPARGGPGVPDAVIAGDFQIYIETKIKAGKVDRDQLERHLQRVADAPDKGAHFVLVLSPDTTRPSAMNAIENDRLYWASFAALDQAIDDLLDDKQEVVSEREAFLLRELQGMLVAENLVGSQAEVVVVAATRAWPMYREFSAYVCQPDRSFQPVKRMAFYCSGEIKPCVAEILQPPRDVEFEPGRYRGDLGKLVDQLMESGKKSPGDRNKVFLLSPPDDKRTLRLSTPVRNDLTAKSGRTIAFTQGQRYVSLDRLREAKVTSELVD